MRKLTIIIGTVFFMLGFTCCKSNIFLQDEVITFYLPKLTDFLNVPPECTRWIIKTQTPFKTNCFETSDNKLILKVEKNRPLSIQAYPVTNLISNEEVQFFLPAGTIYPYDYNSSTKSQTLSWEGGYAAEVFNLLINGSKENYFSKSEINEFVIQFNWEKLLQNLDENSQKSQSALQESGQTEKFYNPWLNDSEKLLTKLSERNFTSQLLEPTYLINISKNELTKCDIFCSYVPQNLQVQKTNMITTKKNQSELFLAGNEKGLLVTAASVKNISLQWLYLPIIEKAL